ncbi:MAG: YihY/virulence factor BrkB family protein [Acidobacteria bacterium]|nr:MAG: YihY/virulence factor BrkB family protein [Acidobacteriota bacterium]
MLKAFRIPITWRELMKRTVAEVQADNCLGLAAQLAYYFFLALFPALLFMVALASFFPVANLMDQITAALARVAPYEALKLIQDQLVKISQDKNGGLLTLGMIGTIWSTSSGVTAIIDTLNQAYDIQEGRPWWKVRALSLALTVSLAIFVVVAFGLVLVGPTLAEKVAVWMHLGPAFTWTWLILQWPFVFALVALAIALVYYFAPDAEQDFVWITPGSVFATILWVVISLAFKVYAAKFGSYNATYGTIDGIIVLLTWFYVSSLAMLVGAELNAEIEHASPYGKDPGEKVAGENRRRRPRGRARQLRRRRRSAAGRAARRSPAAPHRLGDRRRRPRRGDGDGVLEATRAFQERARVAARQERQPPVVKLQTGPEALFPAAVLDTIRK